MGYGITQGKTSFCIRHEHQHAAFMALRHLLHQPASMSGSAWSAGSRTQTHFGYTDYRAMRSATDLHRMLRAWRWEASFGDGRDIVHVTFTGENLGDEDVLWSTLAPYVEDGSKIQMFGEDGNSWTWELTNGNVQRHA